MIRLNNGITVLYDVEYFFALWNRSMGDFCPNTLKRFSDKPIFWRRNYYLPIGNRIEYRYSSQQSCLYQGEGLV